MMLKKQLFAYAALMGLLSAGAAEAQLNVQLNLGQPAYVEPAPVIVGPPAYYNEPIVSSWDPHHRRHDWQYWRDQHAHDPHWHHR